jgi:hypothetical protein
MSWSVDFTTAYISASFGSVRQMKFVGKRSNSEHSEGPVMGALAGEVIAGICQLQDVHTRKHIQLILYSKVQNTVHWQEA